MRGNRRGGRKGLEFGGSGEDSFVAVVVTKLTGALLFILLLTMVIMALLPKANELPSKRSSNPSEVAKLEIKTPERLPEALAGHPYLLALSATGGSGELQWSVAGALPEGLVFDSKLGRLEGTPKQGTPKPVTLTLRVSDGDQSSAQATQLIVYQSDKPLATPVWWKPGIPPIPWRAWLEQGFGFLILMLIHTIGMNTVGSLRRWSLAAIDDDPDADPLERPALLRRFAIYGWTVRLASLSATATLVAWLVWNRG